MVVVVIVLVVVLAVVVRVASSISVVVEASHRMILRSADLNATAMCHRRSRRAAGSHQRFAICKRELVEEDATRRSRRR